KPARRTNLDALRHTPVCETAKSRRPAHFTRPSLLLLTLFRLLQDLFVLLVVRRSILLYELAHSSDWIVRRSAPRSQRSHLARRRERLLLQHETEILSRRQVMTVHATRYSHCRRLVVSLHRRVRHGHDRLGGRDARERHVGRNRQITSRRIVGQPRGEGH